MLFKNTSYAFKKYNNYYQRLYAQRVCISNKKRIQKPKEIAWNGFVPSSFQLFYFQRDIIPYYSLLLNVEAKRCWRACRNVSIIGLSGYNSCRREARKRNEYSCYVAARQFVRVLKLVDDTSRSRRNRRQIVRRQIRRSAVEPSSKVLFHIYIRNETFDPFDNFPEEICRASRAFCYDPAHTYVTALATLLKRPRSPRVPRPRNSFCSSRASSRHKSCSNGSLLLSRATNSTVLFHEVSTATLMCLH